LQAYNNNSNAYLSHTSKEYIVMLYYYYYYYYYFFTYLYNYLWFFLHCNGFGCEIRSYCII
ncbi:MAG: hypothetical protein N7Q72_07355, partial [Spiroplasma sp. Tabriz.8]|nr:hypothetical protein [Spiroplasma sp. Tabriz.8]